MNPRYSVYFYGVCVKTATATGCPLAGTQETAFVKASDVHEYYSNYDAYAAPRKQVGGRLVLLS